MNPSYNINFNTTCIFFDLMIGNLHKKMNSLIEYAVLNGKYEDINVIKFSYESEIDKYIKLKIHNLEKLNFDEGCRRMQIIKGSDSLNQEYQYAVERAFAYNSELSIFKQKYCENIF